MESQSIYEKNKEINKEKIQFFNFLMYATKAEIAVDEFQTNLFWTGSSEALIFLLSLVLFISKPGQFWPLLFFVTHLLRGIEIILDAIIETAINKYNLHMIIFIIYLMKEEGNFQLIVNIL